MNNSMDLLELLSAEIDKNSDVNVLVLLEEQTNKEYTLEDIDRFYDNINLKELIEVSESDSPPTELSENKYNYNTFIGKMIRNIHKYSSTNISRYI